jgi:hypothetical protein
MRTETEMEFVLTYSSTPEVSLRLVVTGTVYEPLVRGVSEVAP